jgi:hypothetical protein
MKLKVTEKGVSQEGKDIAVGDTVTVAGDTVPPSLVNKVVEVEGGRKAADDTKKDEPTGKSHAEVLAIADGNFMAYKSAAKKLLGDATPASKDEITAALIDKLSDTELKTYLGSKSVEVKDETREQLVELAKAA